MHNTSLLRRLAAIFYDALLLASVWFLATIPFIAVRNGEPVAAGDNFLYQIVLLLVSYAFFVGFWSKKGRTLGMQSWGLQIESRNQRRPTHAQLAIRYFAAILSWVVVGLGFLWQLWDRDKLCWHDRLSGTQIVYYPRVKADTRD